MNNYFYITTPIYYSNWVPHIWHSYSSLLADILARAKRLLWYKVKFSTWVDENAQKNVLVAQEKWLWIMEFLDSMAEIHKSVWDGLEISYTDFIRTTQENHHQFVQYILQKTYDNWDIYQWEYKWLYCVWCEAFKKENDLINGLCPDHQKKPEYLVEKNWFFRLSKYQDKLLQFYKENPNFIYPEFRFNEIKAWFDKWLEDFSISRQTNKFWIILPFDKSQVTYVWYDALVNYLTLCQTQWQQQFWPANFHIIWKEISRFHAIFWLAMLISAWYELPKKEVITWFLTVDWQKISKTIWNVIDPAKLAKEYSRDAIVMYLFTDLNIWNDWDFSWEKFKGIYNWVLVWWWGNLVSRIVSLSIKNSINISIKHKHINNFFIDNYLMNDYKDNVLLKFILQWIEIEKFEEFFDNILIWNYLKQLYELIQICNLYIQSVQPWVLLKDQATKIQWIEQLQYLLFMIRQIWILSSIFLIDWFEKLKNILWDKTLYLIKTSIDANLSRNDFKKIFDIEQFEVNLTQLHLYELNSIETKSNN